MKLSAIARRERAAKRFSILSFVKWSVARGGMGHVDTALPLYKAYVERKNVEAKALGIIGIGHNFVQIRHNGKLVREVPGRA